MSLTESTPHLVPVMTRPGSRVSPWVSSSTCPDLYTCVPIHWIFLVPTVTVVSMRTALFSMGLEADVKHWIFPHLASLEDMIHKVDHIFVECGWGWKKRRDLCEVYCFYLSLQLLYLPSRSFPQFPNMSPASLTFLKHSSGAARPSLVKRKKKTHYFLLLTRTKQTSEECGHLIETRWHPLMCWCDSCGTTKTLQGRVFHSMYMETIQ